MKLKSASKAGYMTSLSERASYWSYFVGQNFSYALMVSFLPTYLMMIGVNVSKIAAAIFLVKVWDAVNDTIFGIIFDKVKFKSGKKCLPWLRMSMFFIPAASFIMYLIPAGMGETGKLIWFIVAYVLWDTAYTLSDVPIYTLATSMTNNLMERNSVLSIGRIFATGGAGIAMMLCTVLISEQVGLNFQTVALIVCVGIFLTMLPISFTARERIAPDHLQEEGYTFRSMFRYLGTNKYLLYYYLGYIISGVLATSAPLELFVSYYLFGSALFSTLMLVISALPMLIVALFIQKLLARFDKFKLFRTCIILNIILGAITYLIGYHNIYIYIAMTVLRSVPTAVSGILNLTFTPDCVEYGQYKTGIDARGIAFAVQSFAAKLSTASQSVGLLIVGLFGWVAVEASSFAELESAGIVQSATALNGLWFTYTLVPVIGGALALIPYFLYKLNDKDVQIMARYNAGEITREEADRRLSRKY